MENSDTLPHGNERRKIICRIKMYVRERILLLCVYRRYGRSLALIEWYWLQMLQKEHTQTVTKGRPLIVGWLEHKYVAVLHCNDTELQLQKTSEYNTSTEAQL